MGSSLQSVPQVSIVITKHKKHKLCYEPQFITSFVFSYKEENLSLINTKYRTGAGNTIDNVNARLSQKHLHNANRLNCDRKFA